MNEIVSDPIDERPRRPLKARDLNGWRSLAVFLVQKGVRPNSVSLLGLGAGVGTGVLLAATSSAVIDHRILLPVAIFLILLRGFCNILDGVMAVEAGAATPVGALYNEVPDRISDVAMFLGAGYAMGSHPALGWAAALAAVFTAYIRVECHAAGARADYGGLFGKPGRMIALVIFIFVLIGLPGGREMVIPLGGGFEMGLLGLGLLVIAAGSAVTAFNRLRRAARSLSVPVQIQTSPYDAS